MAFEQGGTLKNKKYQAPAPFPKVKAPQMEIEKGEKADNENQENAMGMKPKKNRSAIIKSLMK